MKKIVRILGVTLTLLVLASCSKDEGDGSPDTTLSVSNLKGTYKYTGMSVEKAVDLNGDGVFNNDLSKENYKECLYDNTIEITDTQYTFQMKGAQCDPSETNLVFTYTLDKTAVFRPALEVCKAARKPAPPPPTITASKRRTG